MVQSIWYQHIGKGLCTNVNTGYYTDHNEDTVDAEKCAIHCNEERNIHVQGERECVYFSINANANKCRMYKPKKCALNACKCTADDAQDYDIYKSTFYYASRSL